MTLTKSRFNNAYYMEFIFNKCYLLESSIALLAIFSLIPYFIWADPNFYWTLISTFTICVYLYFITILQEYDYSGLIFGIILSIFLLYITLLPTINGGHKEWFYLIPITLIIFSLSRERKIRTLNIFTVIFTFTLLPSVLVWFLCFFNVSLNFDHITAFNKLKTADNIFYYHLPWVIFANDTTFHPQHLTLLFRVAGIYDEPGRVGTIAGLLLAAQITLKKINNKKLLLFSPLMLAGSLSYSTAFYIITLLTATLSRQWKLCCFLLIFIIPPLLLQNNTLQIRTVGKITNFKRLDDRSNSNMQHVFQHYTHSSVRAKLLGFGSDANSVFAPGASSIQIIFINYGIIGFIYIVTFFILYSLFIATKGTNFIAPLTFTLVFLLSIYQRPFVWVPEYLLIFCGAMAICQLQENSTHKIL